MTAHDSTTDGFWSSVLVGYKGGLNPVAMAKQIVTSDWAEDTWTQLLFAETAEGALATAPAEVQSAWSHPHAQAWFKECWAAVKPVEKRPVLFIDTTVEPPVEPPAENEVPEARASLTTRDDTK